MLGSIICRCCEDWIDSFDAEKVMTIYSICDDCKEGAKQGEDSFQQSDD